MMYQNKVVAAIKVNGNILRENKDLVTLPFGSEYSVYLKNLNSVRIKVKLSVDGVDATEGTWIIISPNSSIELERFIKNGNWNSGNRFKFIERTEGIEAHRGIKAEDGLVRVEYQTEQVAVVEAIHRKKYYDDWPSPHPRYPDPYYPYPRRPIIYGSNLTRGRSTTFTNSVKRPSASGPTRSLKPSRVTGQSVRFSQSSLNDTGITVPGSLSNQQFFAAEDFKTTGHSEVIVLRLRGVVSGKVVMKAVTVKHKPSCETCGKSNKPNNQFCSNCGTALTIY